jgi:hypothetical protein
MEKSEGDKLVGAVSGSGFPFQTAIAATIRSMKAFNVEEEVAWAAPDGAPRFLDIVAATEEARICMECKVFKSEKLIFLLPNDAEVSPNGEFVGVFVGGSGDSGNRPLVKYGVLRASLDSPESRYCVTQGDGGKESRLIEKELQPLIQGAERYLIDRIREFRREKNTPCIPVLCTTAKLYVVRYDPRALSLADGIFRGGVEDFEPVKCVRFTKEFTATGAVASRRRTALIMNSLAIAETLPHIGSTMVVRDECVVFDQAAYDSDRRKFNYPA